MINFNFKLTALLIASSLSFSGALIYGTFSVQAQIPPTQSVVFPAQSVDVPFSYIDTKNPITGIVERRDLTYLSVKRQKTKVDNANKKVAKQYLIAPIAIEREDQSK